MEPECYLLGMRQAGWLTVTGQYSTDIKDARKVGYGEALKIAARHKEASNILIPVRVEDVR